MTAERIPMGRMFIDDEMLESAQRILASGQWIKGPESKAFGAEWAEYCGALSGTPCSNGSVALIAALLAALLLVAAHICLVASDEASVSRRVGFRAFAPPPPTAGPSKWRSTPPRNGAEPYPAASETL